MGSPPRRLSLVLPAYNEAPRIPSTLESIRAFAEGRFDALEVLWVDDGSTDGTAALLGQAAAVEKGPLRVRVLALPQNQGKGAAVRRGMLEATEPWVLMSDADLSTPLEELDALWRALEGQGADVALGSRGLPESRLEIRQPLYRETMGRTFNLLVKGLVVGGIHDTQCGFKLLRREVAQALFSRARVDRFAFDVEVVYLARKLGLRVVEVPVRWSHAEGSRVRPVQDSARMFADLLRIRWMHRGG